MHALLSQCPTREVELVLPRWMMRLDRSHPIRSAVLDVVRSACEGVQRIGQVGDLVSAVRGCRYVESAQVDEVDFGKGAAIVTVTLFPELFYNVLSEETGLSISDEGALMKAMTDMAAVCKKYRKIQSAMEQVETTGYGIVMPDMEEMVLEEPEIIRQSGRYGVRLRAAAPSIHMIRADIETEVSPIVGSEKQSEELVNFMLSEFAIR